MSVPKAFAIDGMMNGRYRLIERIGAGGMATVWRAYDEPLDREVAIKVFTAAATTPETVESQEREARITAKMGHHGLVTLLDAGVDQDPRHGDRIFLVMELVEGSDLKERLASEPLTPREIAFIGYDLAEALEYLHHHRVVHRDIKPANVLLPDYRGGGMRIRAKLTDFGIALPADLNIPDDGKTTGTAAYLSPEQANLEIVGPASDIYSLGLVLLECFTRTVEFPGDVVHSALARLMRDPVIPGDLDPEWSALLTAMTARDPKARPTASETMLILRDLVISNIGRRRRHVDPSVIPFDEASRMAAVQRLDLSDSTANDDLDRITALAARVLRAPVAMVSIVDSDRIWIKSKYGVGLDQIGREPGLCASAVLGDEPWIVQNARTDPRSKNNSLVLGAFGLQSYVGVPLTSADGHNYGTLSILDFEPRRFTDDETATLVDLAALAEALMRRHPEQARRVDASS